MSKSIANVVISTDSFSTLITRVNQISDAMTYEVVTANGSSSGATTTGNVAIVGTTSSNTLAVTTSLRGGTVATAANLNVTSNLTITGTTTVVNSNFIANTTTIGLYSNNATIGGNNATISTSNVTVSGNVTVTGKVNANNDFYIHNANTTIDAYYAVIDGATLDLDSTALNINANTTTFTSNTTINGPLSVSDDVTLNGDILFGTNGLYGRQKFAGVADLGSNTSAAQLVWTYPKTQFTLASVYTVVKSNDTANVQATQAAIITNGNDAYMTVFAVLAAPNTANLGVFTIGTDSANVNLYYKQNQTQSSVVLNITLNS